jgi:hypothetical protein
LPLFGKKDHTQALSVRSLSHWEEAVKAVGDQAGVEYELLTTQPIPTIYGGATAEVARDKLGVTMLVPSSLKARLDTFLALRLNSLDIGSSLEAKGGTIVGHGRTCVSRLFVDSFVSCMKNVYTVSQEYIRVRVHRAVTFPMLLVSDPLTMIIAPIRLAEQEHWETGKYEA